MTAVNNSTSVSSTTINNNNTNINNTNINININVNAPTGVAALSHYQSVTQQPGFYSSISATSISYSGVGQIPKPQVSEAGTPAGKGLKKDPTGWPKGTIETAGGYRIVPEGRSAAPRAAESNAGGRAAETAAALGLVRLLLLALEPRVAISLAPCERRVPRCRELLVPVWAVGRAGGGRRRIFSGAVESARRKARDGRRGGGGEAGLRARGAARTAP